MCEPENTGELGETVDPDAVLWVRGVDYLTGWRDARDAAAELLTALSAAGVETSESRAWADTGADGAGVVRLALPAEAAREVAMLARVTAARLRRVS